MLERLAYSLSEPVTQRPKHGMLMTELFEEVTFGLLAFFAANDFIALSKLLLGPNLSCFGLHSIVINRLYCSSCTLRKINCCCCWWWWW